MSTVVGIQVQIADHRAKRLEQLAAARGTLKGLPIPRFHSGLMDSCPSTLPTEVCAYFTNGVGERR